MSVHNAIMIYIYIHKVRGGGDLYLPCTCERLVSPTTYIQVADYTYLLFGLLATGWCSYRSSHIIELDRSTDDPVDWSVSRD